MSRETSHCDLDELALAALGDTADLDADHLATCQTCQAEIASLRRVVRTARASQDTSITSPSPDVWTAVRRAMEADGSTLPDDGPSADTGAIVLPLRRRSAPWIAVAAGIGILLGAVAGVAWTQRTDPTPTVIAQATLQPLPGYASSGTARVEAVDQAQTVTVDLTGLPATDGYFEVWLLADDARSMISLGTVGPGERSTLPLPAGLSLDRFRIVDVSAEDIDGDPTHSAISVARGTLQA